MKRLFFTVIAVLMATIQAATFGQVRIGANENPHTGAVLDLTNSKDLGFKLPNVALTDAKVFQLSNDGTAAKGMMVYNINAAMNHGYGLGVYVWDGSAWTIMSKGGSLFVPADYGTPDGSTSKPSLAGTNCYDVKTGKNEPGTQQYTITEGGTKTIKNVIWSVSATSNDLLKSSSVGGVNNTVQTLVFKSKAELSATAATSQTITLTAYIEYTDNVKVKLGATVRIQNQACCQGTLIIGGAFTSPSAAAASLTQAQALALGSPTGMDLCIGPDMGANKTWNAVAATDWCNTNIHNLGGAWNDGEKTWRLPNIVELANMHNSKTSIPNLAVSSYYWSSTEQLNDPDNALLWYFYKNGNSNYSDKTYSSSNSYTRCVRSIK
ncbi:MAG: DUF1566 domain-containing protein [Dysgonamonadaceae bacterium]|jgi:hypothetical protein|nr:DUF1566 domain-containing protein [Dysgonamonadaceae bacterium]